jgi:hypothetical protein
MEAALALGRGCCCTKSTVEALRIAASGSSRDGNPGERCARVRWAALDGLQNCLCNCGETLPDAPYEGRPENPPEPLAPGEASEDVAEATIRLQPYYMQLAQRPASEVLREARATVALASPQTPATPVFEQPVASQGEGLVGLWHGSRAASPTPADVAEAVAPTNAVPASSPSAHLRRLPATGEPLPEPVFLSRQPRGSMFR